MERSRMLLLATDLDGSFLGGNEAQRRRLYHVIRNSQHIRLVFVTGRGVETVMPLLEDAEIPRPHYIICDVGATIVNGHTLEAVQPIQAALAAKWPGRAQVEEALKMVRGLKPQEVPQARRCSFYYNGETDLDHLRTVAKRLNCDVILSAGRFADVLPGGVNKGTTLVQLVKLLGFPTGGILVAGDTLNDLSLYETGYRGVVVGEAEPELLEATKSMSHVYIADQPGAGGIMEAMGHFPDFRHLCSSQAGSTVKT